MPLVYGPSANVYNSLITPKHIHQPQGQPFNWMPLIRGLLIATDIAISLIPAVGIWASLGFSFLTEGALTAMDIAEGSFSWLNTAIGFGTLGISAGISLNRSKKIIKNVKENYISLFKRFETATVPNIHPLFGKAPSKIKLLNHGGYRQATIEEMRSMFKKVNSLSSFAVDIGKYPTMQSILRKSKLYPKEMQDFLIKSTTKSMSRVFTRKEILLQKQLKRDIDIVSELVMSNNLQRKMWTQLLDKRTRPKDLARLAWSFKQSLTQKQALQITKQLGFSVGVVYAGKNINKDMLRFFKNARQPSLLYQINPRTLQIRPPSQLKHALRWMGTSRYNDKIVQRIQNIDPNDLGRYFVERAYRFLKERIRSPRVRFLSNKTAKVFKTLDKVDKAFVESGGTWMGGNFISSFKVLNSTQKTTGILTTKLVLVRFNRLTTSAKNRIWNNRETNNYGGKRDVLVSMTSKEIRELQMYGGQYYLEKFARTKGGQYGKNWNLANDIPIRNTLSLFLGFIPQNALRLNLSIMSNVVKTAENIAKGTYATEWSARFTRSFIKSFINRSIRLTTRELLPSKTILSRGVGRELSRVSTATSNLFMKINKHGNLTFGMPTGSRVFSRYATAGLMSGRGRLLKKARKGRTQAQARFSARTKINQGIRRVPGALLPSSVYNARRFGKIKLR